MILLIGLLSVCHAQMIDNPQLVVPEPQRELRGAWVATVWNIDWPTTRNNVTSQRAEMNTIINAADALNLNCLFLQVRSQCDAMYPSTLEPWSYFLTGRMGRAPSPANYDPLAEWIAAAHAKGIRLYAWFNPYRALVQTPGSSDAGFVAANHVSQSQANIVVDYASQKWLIPGASGSAQHSKSVILDVVQRYDIDGVVFDDYFFPYPDGNPFPDSAQYASYTSGGGSLSLSDWRRNSVNNFVFDLNQSIKLLKPGVHFGIGPFGIWQSGVPSGVVGLSAYDSLYADSKHWLNMGWVDFLAPQLYWRISAPQQSYPALLSWWVSQNWQNRHVWVSNYTSKLTGTGAWPLQEILDQINVTRNQAGASGNVHYSMKALRDNYAGVKTALMNGPYLTKALLPSFNWIDPTAPMKPNLNTVPGFISWSAGGSEVPHQWVLSTMRQGSWSHEFFLGTVLSKFVAARGLQAVAIRAVDRQGNASPVTSRVFDASVLPLVDRPR